MDRITLSDLIQSLKAQAIADSLVPSEVSLYRQLCRSYSITFHTPLHMVYDLQPQEVIMSVFEHKLDEMDIEENMEALLEMIYQIEDPSYDAKAEDELAEFIAQSEEEERVRLAEGLRVGQARVAKVKAKPGEALPASGGVNLAYLQDLENER